MYILILLGMTVVTFGIAMLFMPKACFDLADKYFFAPSFQYGCSAAGLLLGIALYFSASASKYPDLFQSVAILSGVGSIICLILPSSTFKKIVAWELETFSPFSHFLAVSYFIVGGFTVYSAL